LRYNSNGGAVPEDPDPPLTDNTSQDSGAAWSPDGSKIAFERNSDLWVMNSDGTKQTRLTNNAIIDSNPTWSPDGSQIAFVSERDGDLDIWAMMPVPETNNIGNNFPRISPTTAAAEHSIPTRPGHRICRTARPG
jgi:Tol biopolymer transport system component